MVFRSIPVIAYYLAVLTDQNLNVMYELGIRHSIQHGTIMMIEGDQIDKLPFDIQGHDVITYKENEVGLFQDKLGEHIEGLRNVTRAISSDNPVQDYFTQNPIRLTRIASSPGKSELTFDRALDVAEESVLVVGQNLAKLASSKFKIKLLEVLENKNITVMLLICHTNFAKETTEFTGPSFEKDLKDSKKEFSSWRDEVENNRDKYKGKLELKQSKRLGNISITFVDAYPETKKGQLQIMPVPWASAALSKPCILLSSQFHDQEFNFYRGRYDTIWRSEAEDI